MPQFIDYNRTIVGYHGTSKDKAQRIVRTQAFAASRNDHDWLGHGIYFWEYAPKQALRWAQRKYKSDAAVVASMLRLGNCLDLLDPENASELKKFHDELERALREKTQTLRENANAKKYRDCAVLESYYQHALTNLSESLDSSRGVYVPTAGGSEVDGGGYRLWKRSWLTLDAHIQICVRPEAQKTCILGTWPVDPRTMT